VFVFVTRTCRIIGYTVAFVSAFAVHRLVSPASGPRLLRWYLQSVGAAFVKVGQILAMRYDVLPGRYCQELSKLLDSLPPIPHEQVVRVIEADLGVPIEDCFSEFEPQALAAASIAQVHGARLHNGQSVVVKVVRPGVAQRFRVDCVYLQLGAWLLDRLGMSRSLDLSRLMRELIAMTREELDFQREARNIWEMHEAMLSDGVDHYSPALVEALSGKRTLTMERLEGVSVAALIGALESGDSGALEQWAEIGIEPERTAALLMRSILEQSMRHQMFHADPHAANLIVLPGGTLGWIDFGMLGWLEGRLWRAQFGMREALAEGDHERAYSHLLSTLEPVPAVDLSGFESEVIALFRDWTRSSRFPNASLLEKSSGLMFLRMFDSVRRAGLRMPTSLVRLYRAIFVGDIVMLRLDPTIDWVPIMRGFVADEVLRRGIADLARAGSPAAVGGAVRTYLDAPRTLAALGAWVDSGLPTASRAHQPRSPRAVSVIVRYLRFAALIGLVVLLGSWTLAPLAFPDSAWDKLDQNLGSAWWLLVSFDVFAIALLGRLLRVVRGG
jgi:ubiquinone biosynthesis protein